MKKLNMMTMLLASLIMVCCSKEPMEMDDLSVEGGIIVEKGGKVKSSRELIVKYDSGTTDEEKSIIRNTYEVENYKQCSCVDDTLELWSFSLSTTQTAIEEKKNTASDDPDLDGVLFNNAVQLQNNSFTPSTLGGTIDGAINMQVQENENVTIAVLDTGVNYVEGGFSVPFLYNNRNNEQCEKSDEEDFFGWDFVNEDNDPFDDNNHGTYISRTIADNLNDEGIPFQILPVKVFDAEGSSSTFLILCGYRYALSKPEVKIVNMSFGSYLYQELFDRFLSESQDQVLVVTSAGNETNDNDESPHYPSSYGTENILAIAGLKDLEVIDSDAGSNNNNGGFLTWFSNYGVNSVDIAAPSQNYSYVVNGQNMTVSGTSFACAYASYRSAALYADGVTPIGLKNKVIDNSIVFPSGLDNIKHRAALLE